MTRLASLKDGTPLQQLGSVFPVSGMDIVPGSSLGMVQNHVHAPAGLLFALQGGQHRV
jgi:hypothetical protein